MQRAQPGLVHGLSPLLSSDAQRRSLSLNRIRQLRRLPARPRLSLGATELHCASIPTRAARSNCSLRLHGLAGRILELTEVEDWWCTRRPSRHRPSPGRRAGTSSAARASLQLVRSSLLIQAASPARGGLRAAQTLLWESLLTRRQILLGVTCLRVS